MTQARDGNRECRGRAVTFRLDPSAAASCLLVAATLSCTVPETGLETTEPPVNVLLLVVDTLRADVLECYGGTARTPNICALARRGVLFERAHSDSPWTYPSAAAMFTSQPSSRWELIVADPDDSGRGAQVHYRIPETRLLLTKELADSGWDVVGTIENPIALRAGGLRGLKRLEKIPEERLAPRTGRSRRPAPIGRKWGWRNVERTIRFLAHPDSQSTRFFLVHWFNDPHAPYKPTPREAERLALEFDDLPRPLSHYAALNHAPSQQHMETLRDGSDREVELVKRLYRLEVESVDRRIGQILRELSATDLEARTLVVLTSDHGEAFGEHDEFLHGGDLYQEQVHIPLVIAGPGVVAGAVIIDPVSNLDLVPTLRELLGLPRKADHFGRSLAGYLGGRPDARRPIFLNGSLPGANQTEGLIDGDLKLVVRRNGDSLLFDLSTDPRERNDLSQTRAADAQRLAEILQGWKDRASHLKEADPQGTSSSDAALEETARQLRALGYID